MVVANYVDSYTVGHSYNGSDRINARANMAYSGVTDWFNIYERAEALRRKGIYARTIPELFVYIVLTVMFTTYLYRCIRCTFP